jgi:hypothetical protein
MSLLTAFTTQVLNLATELTNMYPNDSFFKSGLTAASLMKKTNPRLLYNLMMEKMSEYREHIFAENDIFFTEQIDKLEEEKQTETNTEINTNTETNTEINTNTETNTKTELLQEKTEQDNFNFILRVRTYWKEMSPNTKKQIWMYLKVLFKLSDKLNA